MYTCIRIYIYEYIYTCTFNPESYTTKPKQVQFKFCAPNAGDVTSLTESEILATQGIHMCQLTHSYV